MTVDPTVVVAAITAVSAAVGRLVWVIYSDLKRDRDFWRDTALRAMGHTGEALEVVKAKVAVDA